MFQKITLCNNFPLPNVTLCKGCSTTIRRGYRAKIQMLQKVTGVGGGPVPLFFLPCFWYKLLLGVKFKEWGNKRGNRWGNKWGNSRRNRGKEKEDKKSDRVRDIVSDRDNIEKIIDKKKLFFSSQCVFCILKE